MKDEKQLITETDIPKLKEFSNPSDVKKYGMPVIVDGYKAFIAIPLKDSVASGIMIEFIDKHPRWRDSFGTGYYFMSKPGILNWGHDGEFMTLERV